MPTYEYKCSACGHAFERFQSITAAPIKVCPQCRKSKVKRLMGIGAGLIFKGSGFYSTDYRSESYKTGAKAETGETKTDAKSVESTGAGDSKSSSESKPAAESTPATESKSSAKSDAAAPTSGDKPSSKNRKK